MTKEDKLYLREFGDIPDNQLDRIQYILGNRVKNEKYNEKITNAAKEIKKIKYKKLDFIMWKLPYAAARPRATNKCGYTQIYVPGAKREAEWFTKFAKENNLPFINTPCILNLKIYEKTPNSFSIKDKVLAELELLKPWKRTGDFDNYAKGIADAIQHGLLKDDCLVISSKQDLFYSIKPHIEVSISYMERFPEY